MKKVSSFWDMCYYVGKEILVTIVLEDGKHRQTVTGKLRTLADDGDFSIETESGFVFGWPALYLEIEE